MSKDTKQKKNVLATNTFAAYLIMVGTRNATDYTYTDEQLFSNIKYFRKCYNTNLSAYYALLFLDDYIKEQSLSTTNNKNIKQ